MKNLKTHIAATMTLGVLCLIAGWFCHLALTDIYHGEADARLEWTVVRVTAMLVLAFIVAALYTLTRVWRSLHRLANGAA